MTRRSISVALCLALALSVSACGDTSATGGSSPSGSGASVSTSSGSASASASAPAPNGTIADVEVTGAPGAKPTITLKKNPLTVATSEVKVLTKGTGPALKTTDILTMHAEILDTATGKTIDSTWKSAKPASINLGAPTMFPALRQKLPGVPVGSRVLITAPAADAFGPQGQPQFGVGPGDSMAFVLDLTTATTPLAAATGTPVPPKAGLPTVTVPSGKPAVLTTPKGVKPPTALVVQQLIKGAGPKVAKGQMIRVAYTGAIWGTNKVFDSSAKNAAAPYFETPIGVGQVVPGWDKGLVGQTVGSRVLLVIPPKDGYGPKGTQGIKGTDTMMFAVDILAAY